MNNANTATPRAPSREEIAGQIYWEYEHGNLPGCASIVAEVERTAAQAESARYKAIAEKLARLLAEMLYCVNNCVPIHHARSFAEEIDSATSALTEARAAGLLKETAP